MSYSTPTYVANDCKASSVSHYDSLQLCKTISMTTLLCKNQMLATHVSYIYQICLLISGEVFDVR